jgi:hypothetical protein
MDKGRYGIMMEVYSLGHIKMIKRLKGRSMSCKEITLTHYSVSSMKGMKRKRLK